MRLHKRQKLGLSEVFFREIKVNASYFVKLKDYTYYKRKYFPGVSSEVSNKRELFSDTMLINMNISHSALQLH